jgi:hypothetical protein
LVVLEVAGSIVVWVMNAPEQRQVCNREPRPPLSIVRPARAPINQLDAAIKQTPGIPGTNRSCSFYTHLET